MVSKIALVGGGPTALYTLSALLERASDEVAVTIFEQQPRLGLGMPYRPDWNDPAMLANIASFEIPPLTETLLEWLKRQSPEQLEALGVNEREPDDRTFIPRIALGCYFSDQFERLFAQGQSRGAVIDARTETRVVDVMHRAEGATVKAVSCTGVSRQDRFDYVVLATGHQWPSTQEIRSGYFTSPWPASALSAVRPGPVGIRGSSLTAIDTALAIAGAHGQFEQDGEQLRFELGPEGAGLTLTMLSRKGLLPEADFYFPVPHVPLAICTLEAIDALLQKGVKGMLDQVFDLFRREMMLADPKFCEAVGLADATMEEFAEQYFARRSATDPFQWFEDNLREAQRNHAMRVTVPWRYAILRMHEVVAVIVPHLDGRELERFNQDFRPVFVDNYGAVPHQSVRRLLALRHAGILNIEALGDDHDVDTRPPEGGAVVRIGAHRRHFPVFIEATGQKPLPAIQFPFLSLLEQGIVRDADDEDPSLTCGIAVDDVYRPVTGTAPPARLFCLSLPFIMGRRPFIQGLTSSKDMGETVGRALARTIAADTPRPSGRRASGAGRRLSSAL